jgi:hypothetical protein
MQQLLLDVLGSMTCAGRCIIVGLALGMMILSQLVKEQTLSIQAVDRKLHMQHLSVHAQDGHCGPAAQHSC